MVLRLDKQVCVYLLSLYATPAMHAPKATRKYQGICCYSACVQLPFLFFVFTVSYKPGLWDALDLMHQSNLYAPSVHLPEKVGVNFPSRSLWTRSIEETQVSRWTARQESQVRAVPDWT